MSQKILFVSNILQKKLMDEILLHEMIDGRWASQRPKGCNLDWLDVKIQVTSDGVVGASGFTPPRTYNFVHKDVMTQFSDEMLQVSKQVNPNISIAHIRKDLIELAQIIGGRLANTNMQPIKLYRGRSRSGDLVVSSSILRTKSALEVATLLNTVVNPDEFLEETLGRSRNDPTYYKLKVKGTKQPKVKTTITFYKKDSPICSALNESIEKEPENENQEAQANTCD